MASPHTAASDIDHYEGRVAAAECHFDHGEYCIETVSCLACGEAQFVWMLCSGRQLTDKMECRCRACVVCGYHPEEGCDLRLHRQARTNGF